MVELACEPLVVAEDRPTDEAALAVLGPAERALLREWLGRIAEGAPGS